MAEVCSCLFRVPLQLPYNCLRHFYLLSSWLSSAGVPPAVKQSCKQGRAVSSPGTAFQSYGRFASKLLHLNPACHVAHCCAPQYQCVPRPHETTRAHPCQACCMLHIACLVVAHFPLPCTNSHLLGWHLHALHSIMHALHIHAISQSLHTVHQQPSSWSHCIFANPIQLLT